MKGRFGEKPDPNKVPDNDFDGTPDMSVVYEQSETLQTEQNQNEGVPMAR